MIKSITFENFKSFKNKTNIKFNNFNILIGENGSGKSSILQILTLLRQKVGSNVNPLSSGEMLNIGSFDSLVYDEKKDVVIGYEGVIKLKDVELNYQNLRYYFEIKFNNKKIHASRFLIELLNFDKELMTNLKLESGILFDLTKTEDTFPNSDYIYYDSVSSTIDGKIGLSLSYEPEIYVSEFSSAHGNERQKFEKIIKEIYSEIKQDILNIIYIPSLRSINQFIYNLKEGSQKTLIDLNFVDQTENLVSSLEYNREKVNMLSLYLQKILDREIRTKLVPGYKIIVEINNGNKWVNIINEGFGTNQLIFMLYQMILAPKYSLILIEEPEIHLHPSAQLKLIDVIVENVIDNEKYIILTTHSEHILFRFLELIIEKKIDNSELNIFYFERNQDSNIMQIPVNEKGHLNGGMKGFMETNLSHVTKFYESLE